MHSNHHIVRLHDYILFFPQDIWLFHSRYRYLSGSSSAIQYSLFI